MRVFLLAPIALAVAVSAAQLEQRSPFHAITASLVARGIVDPSIIPDQCKSACADTVNNANTCTDINCLCTKSNGKQLKKCVDCLVTDVAETDISTTVGQEILDNFVSACKTDGKDVGSFTVGGYSSSALHLVTNGGGMAAALTVMAAYLL